MVAVWHTDASSKGGYSSWACKIMGSTKHHAGILRTMDTTLAETIAAIEAITRSPSNKSILIISDNLTTVEIIQRTNEGVPFINGKSKVFKKTRDRLINLVNLQDIDAVWVYSDNKNKYHQEIDSIAKESLNEFLAKLK